MNLSKNLFQKSAFRTITTVALAMGLSLPLYAAETTKSVTTVTSEPVTKVVSQSTKVVTTTTTNRQKAKHHRDHHSQSRAGTRTGKFDGYTGVVWKDGTIYQEVEPTGQSQNGLFGIPTSTSDTLQGGITSTVSTVPAN